MDDIFPVVDSRLCFVPSRGEKLFSPTEQLHHWLLSTAEMTTTLGEVHVHSIENSMTVASLHWRIDATKFTVREEMPPRTSPKLQQSEHIVIATQEILSRRS
jgi:hypothetical protein